MGGNAMSTTCPNALRLWPQLLYCCTEECGGDPSHNKGCGITTDVSMNGIVLSTCARLGRPFAVLEQIPENCPKHPNRSGQANPAITDYFYRLDSKFNYRHSSSVCRELREGGEKPCCSARDAEMAKYLLEHEEKIRTAGGETLHELHPHDLSDRPCCQNQHTHVKWLRCDEQIAIRYRCPRSGYSEFAFLLKCNGVKAVLIIGQILFAGEGDNELQKESVVRPLQREQAINRYAT